MARRTEQLRGGNSSGGGRGGHRCHLSGRLFCTARLGRNGVSLVFKRQIQIQRSVRRTRVSSGRSAFPLLPVTCCSISCSLLSPSPSHLRVSSQSYQLTVNMARDKHTHTLLLYSYCVYLALTCMCTSIFLLWGWGLTATTNRRKESERKKRRRASRATTVVTVPLCREHYSKYPSVLYLPPHSAEAEKRRACLCRLLEGPAVSPGDHAGYNTK